MEQHNKEHHIKDIIYFRGTDSNFPTLQILQCDMAEHSLFQELAERSRKYAEDYRIKYIEAASHWVQQEAPDDVNNYIQQFLDGELE